MEENRTLRGSSVLEAVNSACVSDLEAEPASRVGRGWAAAGARAASSTMSFSMEHTRTKPKTKFLCLSIKVRRNDNITIKTTESFLL